MQRTFVDTAELSEPARLRLYGLLRTVPEYFDKIGVSAANETRAGRRLVSYKARPGDWEIQAAWNPNV